jgi:hypothetical protein
MTTVALTIGITISLIMICEHFNIPKLKDMFETPTEE